MKNVERIIILYPGETSSDRVSQPGNYALSRLLIRLHERGDVPIYFLNQSARHEQWGNIEFIHFTFASFLKILARSRGWRNTLIISQTGAFHRHAVLLRAAMPGSRVLVRLGGVYHGTGYLESPSFLAHRRALQRPLAVADMIISTADGTPVDLYMAKLGIRPDRYRKWLNGFPVIPNSGQRRRANRIVCISRLDPVQGINYVLRSFSLARPRLAEPYTLAIVGDGPERANLQALAVDLGVGSHVEFMGHCDDVGPHLYSSRLLVSGLANNPVMEAIATGTPVITLDLGEMEVLYGRFPNVHVVAYPPGGYGRIAASQMREVVCRTADAIVDVLNNSACLDGLGSTPANNLYSWEQRLQDELNLYEQLLEPASNCRPAVAAAG